MRLSYATQGFLTYLQASGYSHSTIALYRMVLDRVVEYLHDPGVHKIKSQDLISYMASLREYKQKDGKPLSGSSLQNHWKSIRSFFRWAEKGIDLKRPDLNLPLPKNNNPKVILPFSEEDVKKLLKAAESSYSAPSNRAAFVSKRRTYLRDTLLIILLLDTGLRASEAVRLNINDINMDTGDLYIAPYGSSNRKTKSRIVHLSSRAKMFVWKYLSTRIGAAHTDPLFVSDNYRMTYNALRSMLEDLGEKAGVDDTHAHRFRHTFCIEYLRNGGDVFTLQRITGHSTLAMLNKYLDIVRTDTSRVHKIASPVMNWKL